MASREHTEAWLDRTLYPFNDHWMEIGGSRLHYVDEGSGPVLLMLHGNGSWSFGFRRIIPGLAKRFRVIAVDYPGFGLSRAAPGFSYKPADHSALIEAFVDQLHLKDLTLFVQDWGGPIGLGLAGRRAELVQRLVICNTWAWPADNMPQLEKFARFASGPLGRFLIEQFNFLERFAVPKVGVRRKLTRAERAGYAGPYPTPSSRRPQTIFPREILASRGYLAQVLTGLGNLRSKPTLLLWADDDDGFRENELNRFRVLLPKAKAHILKGAKHFAQEDVPDEMISAVLEFSAEHSSIGAAAAGSL